MPLTPESRIVAASGELAPLARVLSGEIRRDTGLNLARAQGRSDPGDILLRFDRGLHGEAYRLDTAGQAICAGGDYNAVALATVTLLQAVVDRNGAISIPRMSVSDHPFASYRGLMLDLARQWHTIPEIEQIVELCRLYKIRYLHLHVSDDQSFTFPSTAFPQLATPGRSYTLPELQGLERFAEERGITLVPEMDVPGHSGAAIAAMPGWFGLFPKRGSNVDFGSRRVVDAIDTLIGEMLAVFQRSPYFHIGADEVYTGSASQNPDVAAAMKRLGTTTADDVYRDFISQLDARIRRRGKHTLVWEGFGPGGKVQPPTDITVMEWHAANYQPEALVTAGYPVINACWTPLYIVNRNLWSPEDAFDWNLYDFGPYSNYYPTTKWIRMTPTDRIPGGEVCAWEQAGAIEVAQERRILPLIAERLWNEDRVGDLQSFDTRLAATDGLLEKLVHTVHFVPSGLTPHAPGHFDGRFCTESMTLAMSCDQPAATIRYTLDGSQPTSSSAVYAGPITISSQTLVRAAAFRGGSQVGDETGDIFYPAPGAGG